MVNTIYANGFGDPSLDAQFKHRGCIWSYRKYDDWPRDVVIRNNIVHGNSNEWRVGSDNILPQITYARNFNHNPGFVDPDMTDEFSLDLPDLRLRKGSRCIDSGTFLTEAKESGAGSIESRRRRPSLLSGWDLGLGALGDAGGLGRRRLRRQRRSDQVD